jgi:hypothetical protein
MIDKPANERRIMATVHLRQHLPLKYNRWVTIDKYTRAVVLATNRAKSDLALAFNLDMLEKIRHLMGVPWIPTWNHPQSEMHTPFKTRPDIRPEFVNWPECLPTLPRITWEDITQLDESQWTQIWEFEEVRLEMRARVIGGEIPDEDIPMSEAFVLEEIV